MRLRTGKLDVVPRADVRLLPSRWEEQYRSARDFYVDTLDEDDILHGFRSAAGLPAPGRPLTGWCQQDSRVVFGQWVSTLARFGGSGDREAAEKVRRLIVAWIEVASRDPLLIDQHYPVDKLIGGLVDAAQLVDEELGMQALRDLVEVASRSLSRVNVPAAAWPPELADGSELEWYTLTENLLRAFEFTGDETYRSFAKEWEYKEFWGRFVDGSDPQGLEGLHAYSHLNSVNGAALSYVIGDDERYLRIAVNAHDWFRRTQCYATGGFGPSERTVRADGSLGRGLEFRADSFESPCGSWAAFKLCTTLLRVTGDSRYIDWIERLLYNGVGAAIGIQAGGWHTYYADYRVAGGLKTPFHDTYACCSGSYGQAVSTYPELIFLRDAESVFVNVYVPAQAEVALDRGSIRVELLANLPTEGRVSIKVFAVGASDTHATVALRIPRWAGDVTASIDGVPVEVSVDDLGWFRLERTWPGRGAEIELDLDLRFRAEPVDPQHPDRVAFLRGPAVVAAEAGHHEPFPALPRELEGHLVGAVDGSGRWLLPEFDGRSFQAAFKPFADFGAFEPYRIYFDLPDLPQELW
jgi:hypothetical protein